MKGMLFVHVSPPNEANVVDIRRGTVKGQVGVNGWMLEYQARGYKFNTVVQTEALQGYALFETEGARDAFLSEVIPQGALPAQTTDAPSDQPPAGPSNLPARTPKRYRK